jgi:hypothetical protein
MRTITCPDRPMVTTGCAMGQLIPMTECALPPRAGWWEAARSPDELSGPASCAAAGAAKHRDDRSGRSPRQRANPGDDLGQGVESSAEASLTTATAGTPEVRMSAVQRRPGSSVVEETKVVGDER